MVSPGVKSSLPSSFSTCLASTSHSRFRRSPGLLRAQRRVAIGVRNDGDGQDVAAQGGDGQADAVDGDRAFVHQVAVEFRGHAHLQPPVVVAQRIERRRARRCRPRGPARCGRSAGPRATAAAPDSRASPLRRSPRLLRRRVSGARSAEKDAPSRSTAVRQTPFTAMLEPCCRSFEHLAALNLERPPSAGRAIHRAQLFNDSGEH